MINLTFNVGRDDIIALSKAYYDHSPTVKSAMRRAQLTVPAIMFIMAAYSCFKRGGFSFLLFVCVGLLWALFYPAYVRRRILKETGKMLKESSCEKSFGSYSVTLEEDGIASISPTGEAKYTWGAVTRVQLTPDHLFIYLAGPMGYPIPRNNICDERIQEAKCFVESKIKM